MSSGVNLQKLGSNNADQSFFGRMLEGSANQAGQRQLGAAPAQGNQFNLLSREASRNAYNSIIRPSNWKSALGLQPTAETGNYRYDAGDYATDGSVRARTARSGGELVAPGDMTGDWSFNAIGNTNFGGNDRNYLFNYNNQVDDSGNLIYNPIARAANVGIYSQDSSGVAAGQSNFNKSNFTQFGESGDEKWDRLGGGSYEDVGSIQSQLRTPSSQLQFNNKINAQTSGQAQTKYSQESLGKAGSSKSTQEDTDKGGQLAGLGAQALLAPHSMLPFLSNLPLAQYEPMTMLAQAIGRLTSGYTQLNTQKTDTSARAGVQNATDLNLIGGGNVNLDRSTQANANTAAAGMNTVLGAQTEVGNRQRANLNLNEGATGYTQMAGDVQGQTDTKAIETELRKKLFGRWNENKPQYSAEAGSQQTQSVGLENKAGVTNTNQMAAQNIPEGWVDQHIDKNIMSNFKELQQRFPGLYGNYADANDYATREYYRQNPQATAQLEQNAIVNNLSTVQTTDPSKTKIDYSKAGNQDVTSSGKISLSGQGGADLASGAALTTNQIQGVDRAPFSGAYGSRANPGSIIDLKLNSELDAALTGAGAQTSAVNDLKFKFNDTQYGATLQLQAQRFINNLEEQLPTTRDSQQVIEALRNNPELTALFNAKVAPQTVIKAILDYDNTAKTFKANVSATTDNSSYRKAQVYDPTPQNPNSGDEMVLANVLGDVKQLQAGKLYDIGVTDKYDYNTQYKLPTPLTNQSNEFLQDDKTYSNQLNNNLAYFANGKSDIYNALANEYIDRRYNQQKNFDTTQTDQYINQIDEMVKNGQTIEGYTTQDLADLSSKLKYERTQDSQTPQQIQQANTQGDNYYLPQTETINPIFNYYISGRKGWYGDPRAMDPKTANTLDKYYDYSKWGYGEQARDEYVNGRSPGQQGAGSLRIDPLTGKPLTAARELTPQEFAQAQVVGANPNQKMSDFLGQSAPVYKQNLVPVAGYWTRDTRYVNSPRRWVPASSKDQGRIDYNNAVAAQNAMNTQSINQGVNKYTDPTNYNLYNQVMDQRTREWLLNNPNRPV